MGSTCGFNSLGQPRHAAPGFVCRVDTDNGLWGFCPSSVISASDCGLAGYCFDNAKCSTGCGPLANQQVSVTTFTCQPNFCSTIVSDNGLGQNYLYIGCGGKEVVETLYASPPSTSASTTFSTTASSTPQQSPTTSTISSTTSSSVSPVTEAAFASSTITSSATTSSITTTSLSPAPSTTESASNASTSGRSSKPIGAIVGGVVGGIAIICLTVLAVILVRRKRASPSNIPSESHQSHPNGKGYGHPEDWPSYGSGPAPKPSNPSPPYEAYSREFHEADAIASPTELPAAEVSRIGGGSLKSPKSPAG